MEMRLVVEYEKHYLKEMKDTVMCGIVYMTSCLVFSTFTRELTL